MAQTTTSAVQLTNDELDAVCAACVVYCGYARSMSKSEHGHAQQRARFCEEVKILSSALRKLGVTDELQRRAEAGSE